MEIELNAEAKDRRLNRMVALTVVVLSIFTGLCNIKDGNIVQAMQQAKADSVDLWNEYQAARTKLHIVETARQEMAVVAALSPAAGKAAEPRLADLDREAARYKAEAPDLQTRAKAAAAQYDALNIHDDQFDASEALLSIAISMAAVAALTESQMLLSVSWGFGVFGLFMGVCGFAGWGFHPDVLSNFLG